MKKLRKTFMKREWMDIVCAIRLRTNLSDPFPEKVVRKRLTEFS